MRMNLRILFMIAALLLIPSLAQSTPKARYVWVRLEDGLQYATYSFEISEKER